MASVPVYRGRFGVRQAERLLWRAGFGPRPGQARSLARHGLRHAVYSLTGEDPHDLWIHRLGGIRYRTVGELGPGEQGEIELHLRRGSRYEMWCSIADHRDLGMEATLRVRRHR